jgi:hypothetical protein
VLLLFLFSSLFLLFLLRNAQNHMNLDFAFDRILVTTLNNNCRF